MPAPDVPTGPRGRPLLTVLFWAGVACAPVAAGMLLMAERNGALRIAAVLTLLSVLLMGLSIALRGDAETVRQDLEETFFEEVNGLHKDLRNDIEAAARATNRAFGEKLQLLQGQVEALRGQLEKVRAEPVRSDPAMTGSPGEYGTPADPDRRAGGGYLRTAGSARPPRQRDAAAAPEPDEAFRSRSGHTEEASAYTSRSRFDSPAPASAAGAGAATRPHLSGGVVRHTETVRVTTRQTIVNRQGDVPAPGHGGDVYGDREPDGHWAAPEPPLTAAPDPGDDRWAAEPRRRRRSPYDRPGAEPEDGADWSDLAAGDRWASLRPDERGRELRLGERRAAVRADESGTELRIEDRWAAVRQDEPRPRGAQSADLSRESRRSEAAWRERSPDEAAPYGQWPSDRGWGDGGEELAGGHALPSGEPSGWRRSSDSWEQGWEEPARERVRRADRRRGGEEYGAADPAPKFGAAPRVDFDPSDERWR
ncbi:MAG TPA: hypothetical protein VFX60_08055 [Micromonospora sp.]|nr:hypothetical protein [Micromonospora sp.]